jgi:hypothetical protein
LPLLGMKAIPLDECNPSTSITERHLNLMSS